MDQDANLMGGMSAPDFRRLGRDMVDFVASYWENLESRPVLSPAKPGEILAALPEHPPEHGIVRPGTSRDDAANWEAIFRDLERMILPGLTHWQHPSFFAYFPSNASGAAILGELLSAGLGVQGMLWATSPACTELEMRMMDWMGEALGLPDTFLFRGGGGGVIQGTASEATLAAMLAARARALRAVPPERLRDQSRRLVLYASTQAHSSVVKDAMIAGLAFSPEDREQVRLIPTDAAMRMDVRALSKAIEADLAAGLHPFFICAAVGTTGTTAVDSLREIGDVIQRTWQSDNVGKRQTEEQGRRTADGNWPRSGSAATPLPWLHADAAHAGAACVCPEMRWMLDGIDRADSICINPHKWLLTNFDCDCFWTRHPRELVGAMSITPEYLRNAASDSGAVVDYRDWHVPLGRRFRALKLWFVMRHLGLEGLRAHVREHLRLAALFEQWVRADPRFELAADRTMNLVCFRLGPLPDELPAATDARNRKLLELINAGGRAYLTHTVLPGAGYVLRMAIGATRTREAHVRAAWDLIRQLAS